MGDSVGRYVGLPGVGERVVTKAPSPAREPVAGAGAGFGADDGADERSLFVGTRRGAGALATGVAG